MCNDEEGDYVVTCKCSQYDYDDGDDSQYIATLLMEETTEELQANKIDRLCKKVGFCQSRSRQSHDVGRTRRLATFCADYPRPANNRFFYISVSAWKLR